MAPRSGCEDKRFSYQRHNSGHAARPSQQQNPKKVRTLGGRLSFLLNKMQSDEESRVLLKEESKKTQAQVSKWKFFSVHDLGPRQEPVHETTTSSTKRLTARCRLCEASQDKPRLSGLSPPTLTSPPPPPGASVVCFSGWCGRPSL